MTMKPTKVNSSFCQHEIPFKAKPDFKGVYQIYTYPCFRFYLPNPRRSNMFQIEKNIYFFDLIMNSRDPLLEYYLRS